MRVLIKGGVWSNSEDEILKAAIMKYGKTQWARVASLLNRKSPKQCKARWFEWLDPSIKKTEWTRDEEEKLLHLAKLYPSQWRTVAPLVGRTAAQCMERYERLLDEARRELDKDAVSSEEARRLRPGEIDPAPETRPARPDPVDMDEDEKEMLSEARARLANTRGKKAKRKAREAQLDEARRLASLQKRRELKAAGIYAAADDESKKKKRPKKHVDYASEIPFQMHAPAGFYDTSDEKVRSVQASAETETTDFEAKRISDYELKRKDADERKARHADERKRAKLMKDDLPTAIAQVNRLNDPTSRIRRSELSLPAPVVGDDDVAELAKLDKTNRNLRLLETIGEDEELATAELLDDRDVGSASALVAERAAAARTPRVPRSMDSLAQEAVNAVQDKDLDTPLLGQDQADRLAGTGYDGAEPKRPSSSFGGGGSQRPGSYTDISQRTRTPLLLAGNDNVRGSLLRDDDADSETASRFSRPVSERSATSFKLQKRNVRLGLDHLPAPKYAYDVELPADDVREEQKDDDFVPDAADERRAAAEVEAMEQKKRLSRRSSAVQRDLPRPRVLPADPEQILPPAPEGPAAMIRAEAIALIARDALTCPPRGGSQPSPAVAKLAVVDDDHDLDQARAMIDAETNESDFADFEAAWVKKNADVMYFPQEGRWGTRSEAPSAASLVAAYKAQFGALRTQMAKGATRAARIEARIDPRLEPLHAQAAQLRTDIASLASSLDQAAIQAASFARLHRVEAQALPQRLANAVQRRDRAAQLEAELQSEHRRLVRQRDALLQQSSS